MLGQVLKTVSPGGMLYDAILISTCIALQFGFAYYLEWLQRIGWNGKAAVSKPAEPIKAAALSRPLGAGSQAMLPAMAKSPER